MSLTKFRLGFSILTLGALAASTGQAVAGYTMLASDRFGYAGSYTKYETLDDAQNGVNGTGPVAVVQRDLGMYFANDTSDPSVLYSYFSTAWYYTIDQTHGMGWGNPNNTNLSFIQISNSASSPQVTGTSSAYWTSPALNEFHIAASGANADWANSYARFGDADSANKAGGITRGEFLSYNLDATFSGLNTATWNVGLGAYESSGDTSNMAVNGTFTALFYNPGVEGDLASEGYYRINLSLNTTSWVHDNLDNLNTDAYSYEESYFAASAVVPEPSSIVLASLGALGGLGAMIRGRLRRRAS